MKTPLVILCAFLSLFDLVSTIELDNAARNSSIISCPLLSPILDDITRLDSAISILAPRVLKCKVDYLLISDVNERGLCDSAEADLASYQRSRSSIVERRHSYATRRIAGRSRSISRISSDKWSGEEFSTFYLNYTLRGTPSVLLGASVLDGLVGDGSSEEEKSVKRLLDSLLLTCSANGLDCLISVDPTDEVKKNVMSNLRMKLKIPGFIAGSNVIERLDSFIETINESSMKEGHFSALMAHSTLKHFKDSAKSAAESWKKRFPFLISSESVPVNNAPATFHRILAPLTDTIAVRLFDISDLSLFYPRVNGSIPATLDVFSLSPQHWDGTDPLIGSIVHSTMKPLPTSKGENVPYGCNIEEAHIDLVLRPGLNASEFSKRINLQSHVRSGVDSFDTRSTCPISFPSFLLANSWDSIISPGEVLVIPSGFAVSWHRAGTVTELDENKQVLLLDYSWLDASIVSRVSSSLISSIDTVVGKKEDAFLLDALESGLMDVRIDRLPLSLVDFLGNRTYPIPKVAYSRQVETELPLADSSTSSEASSEEVLTQSPDESEAQFRRRQRKSRKLVNNGRSTSSSSVEDFTHEKQRSIQDDVESRWEDLINGISSPTPLNPIAINWSRDNITLAWHVPPSLTTETFAVFWHGSPLSNEDSIKKAASAATEIEEGVVRAELAASRLANSGRRLKEVIDNATSANLTIVNGSLITAAEVNETGSDGSPGTTLHIISDGDLDFSAFVFNSQTTDQKAEANDNKLVAKRKLSEWEDKLDKDVEFAALKLRNIAEKVHAQLELSQSGDERAQDSPSWRRHDFVHPLPGVADAWLRRKEVLRAAERDSAGTAGSENNNRILHSSELERSRLKRRWDLSKKRALNTADRVLELELDAGSPTRTSSSMFVASGDGFSGRLVSSRHSKKQRSSLDGNFDRTRRLSFKPLLSVGVPTDDHTIRSSESVEWGCGVQSAIDVACVTVTGLVPSHTYTFRIAPVDEDGSVGLSSLPSPSVSTLPLSLSSPFSGPITVDVIDPTSVLISWNKVSNVDLGGLPLIGVLVAREDLQETSDISNINTLGVFSNHVVLPTTDIVASGHQTQSKYSSKLAQVSCGKITGLYPLRRYRFIAHPITALGVAPANEATPIIQMPALTTNSGEGSTGRLLAVLAGSGRIAKSSHAASPISNTSFSTNHGISAFDATSPLLHSAPEPDRLAVFAQLHAAISTAFSYIRSKPSLFIDVPHASCLLERSGLGTGALDVDKTLSSAARALQLDPRTAALGHALGLWVSQSAIASLSESGVETVSSETDPDPNSLLPGFGGIHRYGDTVEMARRKQSASSSRKESETLLARKDNRRRRLAPADPLAFNRDKVIDNSKEPDWHEDIAYWAMASGKVSSLVSTLAGAFESSSSVAKGLVCSNGLCSSPAALEIKRRRLSDVEIENGELMSTAKGRSPCISPLLTIRDRAQTLFVSFSSQDLDKAHVSQTRQLLASINWTIPAWTCSFSSKSFDLEVEYIAAEPLGGFLGVKNVTSTSLFGNSHEFPGRAVLIERGAPLTFSEKTSFAISAGASAVIFIDDERSSCGSLFNVKFDQGCVKGGDKRKNIGFAASDDEHLWHRAREVPILLITRDVGLMLVKTLKG